MRRLACVAAIALLCMGLFGWTSGLRWDTPLLPRARLPMAGRDFQAAIGAAAEEPQGLRVVGIGGDGSTLQVSRINARAQDYQLLRYRFEDFPRTLELSLVFRRADAPQDLQAITVPWPGAGWRTVDLHSIPAWHGEIIELGFAQFATGQLVPSSVAFRPFRLDGAELVSTSWTGALAAQSTIWFGYAPWALMAINALGHELDAVPSVPFAGLAAVSVLLMLGVAAVILRWTMRRTLRGAAISAMALWIVLDLCWLHDLRAKHDLTETVYAGRSWEERERLAPNEDLTFVAAQARDWLSAHPTGQRVFVAADTSYNFFRLLYQMLPQNAAALFYVGNAIVPKDSLIVLYGESQWRYYPEAKAINGRGRTYAAEPVFSSGGARIFRTLADAAE